MKTTLNAVLESYSQYSIERILRHSQFAIAHLEGIRSAVVKIFSEGGQIVYSCHSHDGALMVWRTANTDKGVNFHLYETGEWFCEPFDSCSPDELVALVEPKFFTMDDLLMFLVEEMSSWDCWENGGQTPGEWLIHFEGDLEG